MRTPQTESNSCLTVPSSLIVSPSQKKARNKKLKSAQCLTKDQLSRDITILIYFHSLVEAQRDPVLSGEEKLEVLFYIQIRGKSLLQGQKCTSKLSWQDIYIYIYFKK